MLERAAVVEVHRSATFSQCRRYRWALSRWWDDRPGGAWIGWIMLNPSTADAKRDDPTVRRCIGFSRRWGFAGCLVRNLFALRSTSPRALIVDPDPIGPRNDTAILGLIGQCSAIVAAWGVHGDIGDRGRHVNEMVEQRGVKLTCLGRTKDGHPRHPLYVRGNLLPRRFSSIPAI